MPRCQSVCFSLGVVSAPAWLPCTFLNVGIFIILSAWLCFCLFSFGFFFHLPVFDISSSLNLAFSFFTCRGFGFGFSSQKIWHPQRRRNWNQTIIWKSNSEPLSLHAQFTEWLHTFIITHLIIISWHLSNWASLNHAPWLVSQTFPTQNVKLHESVFGTVKLTHASLQAAIISICTRDMYWGRLRWLWVCETCCSEWITSQQCSYSQLYGAF